MWNNKNLDILIDGMVLKLDQIGPREEIGWTAKFPKWAVAYKFAPVEVTSMLKDVVWQVGRTGKLTPIAEIEPVVLAGATVTRATLNNYGDIERKGVKIGSTVFVRRSNEVIPEILSIAQEYPNSIEIKKPTVCPVCGEKVVEVGANLFCPNKDGCEKQIVNKLSHFASKEAFNIDGLSDKTLGQLQRERNIQKPYQLFSLKREDLVELDSFKDKKSDNLINAIEQSKNIELPNFIYALGIEGVGSKTSKDLAKSFGSIHALFEADFEQLSQIRDVGEIIAKNIFDFVHEDENIEEVNRLIAAGVVIKNPNSSSEGDKFVGLKFVLTGTLPTLKRSQAQKMIEGLGGECSSSVSKNTDYVLAGESAGSKLDKAVALGVKIIDESAFIEMIGKKND